MYEQSQAFLAWAASYDDGGLDIRSRRRHAQWLRTLPCPMLCFEGECPIEEYLAVLMVEIGQGTVTGHCFVNKARSNLKCTGILLAGSTKNSTAVRAPCS